MICRSHNRPAVAQDVEATNTTVGAALITEASEEPVDMCPGRKADRPAQPTDGSAPDNASGLSVAHYATDFLPSMIV
jgi:hypothetical protein